MAKQPTPQGIDEVRCWECQGMFEPWTNERHCSDKCHDLAAANLRHLIAANTSTWQACRHCGTPIRPSASGTYYVDAGEWDNCPNQERSHEPLDACYATEETP